MGDRRSLNADDVRCQSTQTDDGWVHQCGTALLGQRVHHSVHDSGLRLAGSGQVEVQTVPYCPTCHEKPSGYGTPITATTSDWPPVKITVKSEAHSG